ncbi:hypothetical protein OG778_23835 [Streptomyces sp. NBC_00184]|uniref:hypothetical protein n=1 Tax=Streptomyces sp. NBC_00184 TaxID=2975673 RepID=UPI002E292F53|nr:hypothetical protein [Streptomyces sp. NBC_00184]
MDAASSGNINDVYAFSGKVTVRVTPVYCDVLRPLAADLTPDEARLLGLKLIRLADKADDQ